MKQRSIKLRVWDKDEEHFTYFNSNADVLADSNRILTQFVGLRDCQGQEIFENDVVQFDTGVSNSYLHIRIIVWRKSTCGFVISNSKNKLKGTRPLTAGYIYKCNLRVIGNIHQNPDLMSQTRRRKPVVKKKL